MRNITLIILMLGSYLAKGQDALINKTLRLSLPTGVEKPTQENLTAYLKGRKNSRLELKMTNREVYKAGNIIITMNADTGSVPDNLIEQRKKVFDHLHSSLTDEANYTSEIKVANNYKALVMHYDKLGKYSYYYFSGVNWSNNKTFSGMIEYDKAEEKKAKAILKHILGNLRFKQ